MKFIYCEFMLILVVFNTQKVSSRSALEQEEREKQVEQDEPEEIQLHVITKREAMSDIQQDYPYVDGRTFRASEPLDPNGPDSDKDAPHTFFEGFDTESKLFQPEIESDDSVINRTDDVTSIQTMQEEDSNQNETDTNTQRQYSAQYPYSETTSRDQYSESALETQQQRYQENDGVQQTVTSRRVVLAGRGSDSQNNRQYDTRTSRTQAEYHQPSQTSRSGDLSYTSQFGNRYPSNSRQVVTNRRVYTGSGSNQQYDRYNTGTSGTTTYQDSRPEVRGAPYNGPRYIDSNGHYVDARGRHLDSTGRYYDVSGRYNDATMTRMHTYQHVYSGSNGGLGSSSLGTNTGYYNNNNYNSNRRYTSGASSSNGYYDSSGRYIPYPSGSYNSYQVGSGSYVDADRSRPVNSYGGTQFYSGGSSYQTNYDPITSQISSDPTCTAMNVRVTINGLSCTNAISQVGPYVCYNYERVSTECCERCLQVKQSDNVGCEYGDRSQQCRDINPYDCYNERNRQVCCDRCRQFREQRAQSSAVGCEYWDMTPQCETITQRPHLCYLPQNQRVCCHTCPRLENRQEPDCRWGNQSPDMCTPYSADGKLRINCYIREVQEICCASCKSLSQRMRENIPGCEYGDSPVLFYSGGDALDCPAYISQYGLDNCNNREISRKCCYTCYRYRRARG